MDGKMAPQDKMECLVKCCKVRISESVVLMRSCVTYPTVTLSNVLLLFLLKAIFEMLSISNDGKPASADEFLPCLIYVCLKERISRFAPPSSDSSECDSSGTKCFTCTK